LKNFSRSICDIIGIDSQNTQLILERLEQLVEDSKLDKLNDFKRLAKVKNMHEYENPFFVSLLYVLFVSVSEP